MKFFNRYITDLLTEMSDAAFIFLKFCLMLSCLMAVAALYTVMYMEETGEVSIYLCHILKELCSAPAAILLLGAIGSVCLEERAVK